MKERVLNCYGRYKQFKGLPKKQFPKLLPLFYSDNESKEWAYIIEDEVTPTLAKIHVRNNLFCNHESYSEAILFHEFTHIMDVLSLRPKYDGKKLTKIMVTYSEYNASMVEMKRCCGFKYEMEFHPELNYQSQVWYGTEKVSIDGYYLRPLSDASVIIDKERNAYSELNVVDYYSKYRIFRVNAMYYLGKKRFCKDYVQGKFVDISEKCFSDFVPVISLMEKCILLKDFEHLISAEETLWNMFRMKFYNPNPIPTR